MYNEPIEDCIELNLAKPDHALFTKYENEYRQYNPSSDIPRKGISLTSLDGGFSGTPDLDSLRRYNMEHGTNYTERSFITPTPLGKEAFADVFSKFNVGRSHVLRLDRGGFFPWHRDYDHSTFRVIYTVSGCSPQCLVWIEDDKIIPLHDGKFYYINTRKKHAVFSLHDSAVFCVFNFFNTPENWKKVFHNMQII